jgi:hypothetical protein
MSADEVLENLIEGVEKTGVGHNISVCINGQIVTGQLIRSKRYYDLMSKIFDTGLEIQTKDPSEIGKLNTYLDNYRNFMRQLGRRSEDDKPRYIHLENAVIHQGSSPQSLASLWRGKLSAVDGFSIFSVP